MVPREFFVIRISTSNLGFSKGLNGFVALLVFQPLHLDDPTRFARYLRSLDFPRLHARTRVENVDLSARETAMFARRYDATLSA